MAEPLIEQPEAGFDLIVVGTGLCEALVAGAAARAGKSVLHLDHEGHYGSEWASFGVSELHAWLAAGDAAVSAAAQAPLAATPSCCPVDAAAAARRRLSSVSFAGVDAAPDTPLAALRGCSFDLAGPKLAFCTGPLVDVLLRSGAHAYLEFKAVECVAMLGRTGPAGADELRPIPASRAEVFSSTLLSPADKRALMRTLKAAGAEEEGTSALFPPGTSFASALREAGLSQTLADAVMYGIALLENGEGVSAPEGAGAIRRYLSSLGRFAGAGALLAPLYGASELPQAFCRTAAVAGATYVLRRGVSAILMDPAADASGPARVLAVRTAGREELRCGRLAAGAAVWSAIIPPAAQPGPAAARLLRAACIVDAPLLDGRGQMMAVVPPGALPGGGPAAAVRILQLSLSACVVPDGRFMLLLSLCAPAGSLDCGPREALWPSLCALLDTEERDEPVSEPRRPRLRWAVFYEQAEEEDGDCDAWLPPNAALCPGSGSALDVCASVRAAEAAFARLFPDLPFFAPPVGEGGAGGDAKEEDDDLELALLQPQVAAVAAAPLDNSA